MSKPLLVIEFLGVVAEIGNQDGLRSIGPVVPGARGFILGALRHFDVRILTPTDTVGGQAVRSWLEVNLGHSISDELALIDHPFGATWYLAANALRFEGTFPNPDWLVQSRPWA